MSGPVVRVPVGLKNCFKPGLTGVERVNVERLADEPLRVEHLIASLNEKLRARSRRVDVVELNGFAVQRHHALDSLLPGLETGSPRFVVTTVAGPFTQLFVKTLTGREISIVLPSNCWVDDIKSEIEKLEGIPTKHQRLIFAGFLLEDGRSLSFYRVKTGSTIDVGLNAGDYRSLGQGSAWRVCTKGLNVEGRCPNSECEAFKEMVVCPKGFALFNLIKDSDTSCPICWSSVEPTTCGFYDCEWKFEGVQASDGCFIGSRWKPATGERYHRFDADERAGSVDWDSLLITARPVDSRIVVCGMCYGKLGAKGTSTKSCGHKFHLRCCSKTAKDNQRSHALDRCPLCYAIWCD